MVKPRTSKDNRSGGRGGWPGWYRELVELGALFLAVALADLFANTLAHRPLGPVVLISLGGVTAAQRCIAPPMHTLPRPPAGPAPGGPSAVRRLRQQPGAAEARNLWRVRTAVRDNPGSLAALTTSLASHGLNILSVQVHVQANPGYGHVSGCPGRGG